MKKNWFSKILTKIFLPHNTSDFISLVNTSVKKNIINHDSGNMIKGVLKVACSQVSDIMIPKTQMATINLNMSYKSIIRTVIESSNTRLPVFTKDQKDIAGILHTKDLVKNTAYIKNSSINDIYSIIRPALFIPESKKLDSLLRDFKSSHSHLAIVVDEYGVISGLVTIEDILEEIVGEIEDEFYEKERQIVRINKHKYLIDASTEIGVFNEYFKVDIERKNVDTIGGLIIECLEHLGKIGEIVTIGKFKFKITSADDRKINNIEVTLSNDS